MKTPKMTKEEIVDFLDECEESATRNLRETLASNISTYRQKNKLSRAALAGKVGVTEAAIGQYERGVRIPPLDTLCLLSAALNVSIDMLVEHSESEYDAVLEYRFNKAADFVAGAGLFVMEDTNGRIKIRERKKGIMSPRLEGGVVKSRSDEDKFFTLIEYSDRKSFVEDIDFFFDVFFNSDATVPKMYRDYAYCLANDEEFCPIFKIHYEGRDVGFN